MNILEFGCGNGDTALGARARHEIDLTAMDFSPEMIASAVKKESYGIVWGVGDLTEEPELGGKYDMVYTQRCLINLPTWEAQAKAIRYLTGLLKPGGCYIMCENSYDGLLQINLLRENCGLTAITPPWHNIYFWDCSIATLKINGVTLEDINTYSSTYYFLSRVVNAYQAAGQGRQPAYDSDINTLALELPAFGNTAQGKIWVWRKNG